MYVSTWPSLSPLLPISRENSCRKPFPFYVESKVWGYLARGLIYQLFRAMELDKDDVVLVPDYHHGNEIRAIRAAGAKVRFYRTRRDMTPDLEDVEAQLTPEVKVLFVIHYIGWPAPMEPLMAMAQSRNISVVEDCALSMFTELDGRPAGSFGDHAIFCMYKTLPVPNGGLLVSRAPPPGLEGLALPPCSTASLAGRTLELALETLQTHAEWTGRQLMSLKRLAGTVMSAARIERAPVGDLGFDLERANLGISSLSLRILERIDLEQIPEIRRARFTQLASRLRGRTTFLDLVAGPGTCPLFFPLLVEDKTEAVELLRAHGIGAVEFWNLGDRGVDLRRAGEASFLRRHVIELPIHQDVTPEQVEYIADIVLASRLGMRSGPAPQTTFERAPLREAG